MHSVPVMCVRLASWASVPWIMGVIGIESWTIHTAKGSTVQTGSVYNANLILACSTRVGKAIRVMVGNSGRVKGSSVMVTTKAALQALRDLSVS